MISTKVSVAPIFLVTKLKAPENRAMRHIISMLGLPHPLIKPLTFSLIPLRWKIKKAVTIPINTAIGAGNS